MASVAEVALCLEAPVQVANDPVLHRHGVERDLAVDLGAPAGEGALGLEEGIDEALVVHADVVGRALEIEALVAHENGHHVVGSVAHGLFHVVRVEILSARRRSMRQIRATHELDGKGKGRVSLPTESRSPSPAPAADEEDALLTRARFFKSSL